MKRAFRAARVIARAAAVAPPRTTPGSSTSGSSVDHELKLQLDRLGLAPLVLAEEQSQLQLDSANPALIAPLAMLQLDRLQLDSE